MIEKPLNMKHFEKSEQLIDGFRKAVASAQAEARDAGVPFTFVVDGKRFRANPNGEIEPLETGIRVQPIIPPSDA